MKKKLILALTIILVMCLASCGGGTGEGGDTEQGYPMTVTDYIGTEMTIEKAPEKIVSLSPSCTEILYELGLGDKVIGVSNWCTYPEEAQKVEKIGDTFSVNVERIIEMEADIVFVSGSAAADSVKALNAAGIPVYSIGAKSLDDIYTGITNLGTIAGCSKEAEDVVADLKEDAEEVKAEFAEFDKKSVFIDLGGLYSTSKEDYLGNSLSLINAENIALDFDYSSPQLSAETVIESNPQVYIVLSSEDEFVKPDGFDQIDAFKNDEVYYLEYSDPAVDMITRDGPRFVDGLEVLGNLIHNGTKGEDE